MNYNDWYSNLEIELDEDLNSRWDGNKEEWYEQLLDSLSADTEELMDIGYKHFGERSDEAFNEIVEHLMIS